MQEFKLPNLGENVEQGDVLRVLVKPGDRVTREQAVLELETDKATLEVPSSVDGLIRDVLVKVGDKVTPGQAIFTLDADTAETAPAERRSEESSSSNEAQAPTEGRAESADAPSPQGQEAGRETAERRAPDIADEGEPAIAAPAGKGKASVVDIRGRQPGAAAAPAPAAAAAPQAPQAQPVQLAPASPSVRRLAREIGVDLSQVTGSGPGGRISDGDVKAFARHVMSSVGGGASVPAPGGRPGVAAPALPDFSKWGAVESRPMSGIRRKTAEHLTHAWTQIPHVTQFDKADVTQLEALRPTFAKEAERAGGKLTVTAILAKILASAVKAFPQFNASIDVANDAIVYKQYVHIGIAVDTEHGLLVPVVRDADRKNILQIAAEIQQLAERARARKLSIDEMSGGSMTLTNLGGIGGTAFTPIVNWPEVAILGVSRGTVEGVWNEGTAEPRQMLPLSLSYDHRVIDGADAIRFLRWVVEAIEQPFTLLLRG